MSKIMKNKKMKLSNFLTSDDFETKDSDYILCIINTIINEPLAKKEIKRIIKKIDQNIKNFEIFLKKQSTKKKKIVKGKKKTR